LGVSAVVLESLHRVGFSGSSLAVSQNRGIVALKYTVNRSFRRIFIDKFLGGVLIIDIVEAVALPDTQMRILLDVTNAFSLVDFLSEVFHYSDRTTIGGNLNDRLEVSILALSQ